MSLLVAFDSTHTAIKLEKLAKAEGLKARLIGTPESISASCGLALKAQFEDLATIWGLIQANEIENEVQVFQVIEENHTKKYLAVDCV